MTLKNHKDLIWKCKHMEKPLALIVEDDRDVAALFRQVIDMTGYQTEIAFHGQVAVERLSNCQPDLVILDLGLPGVSGNEILGKIRHDERLSHTKVIVITGYSQVAENLSEEPDLLLYKPVSMEQFSDFIERFHLKAKYQTTIPLKDEPWDRVTGLYSKNFFENRLNFALRQSKENNQYMFAIISIIIDPENSIKNQIHFKSWMSALRKTANALQAAVRPIDTIARFEQGKFYILIENVPDIDFPKMIASCVHKKLNEGLAGTGNQEQFPISINILLCDSKYEDVREVLQDAYIMQSQASAQEEVD
jgi:PleD family two-component response regulator